MTSLLNFKKYFPIALLIMWLMPPCFSQDQSVQLHGLFEQYSSQKGLSQNDVRCIFQDSFGYIWVGTHGGLNRFDGYSFKNYIRNEGSTYSISSNLISSITEDTLGNLWIGTDDMGVMLLDRKTDTFIHYYNTEKNPQLLTDNHIQSIFTDKANNIWAVSLNGFNILTLAPESEADHKHKERTTIIKYPTSESFQLFGVVEDPSGTIWLGTSKGMSRYLGLDKQGNHQFINYENELIPSVRHLTTNDTSLILSTGSSLISMPYKSISNNELQFHLVKRPVQVSQLISDSNGNIWYTNRRGVHVIYENEGALKTHDFAHDWSDPKSLSSNIATFVMEDNTGMIWVGTNGGGLNLYNPKRRSFDHHRRNSEKGSISYNKIRSIEEDHQGNIWFGTEGGGINLALNDEKKGVDFVNGFQNFEVNPNQENYAFALLDASFEKRHRTFIGTGYLSFFEAIDRDKSGRYHQSTVQTFRPGGPVFDLFQDSKTNIWLATYGKGLFQLKMNANGDIIGSRNYTTAEGLSSNIVRSIAEDKKGNLWVGTDHGLNKLVAPDFDKKEVEIIVYTHSETDPLSLSYDYVIPIFVSKTDKIWVGTLGGGLNGIIPGTGIASDQFDRVTVNDGLPSNVIKSIEEDQDGNLWMGTNKGLSKYNPLTHQIVNYGLSDGLQDVEFSEMASKHLRNGQMIFGGVNGFNTFFPDKIESDKTGVNLVFTDFTVLNQEIQTGKEFNGRVLLKDNLNRLDRIDLTYDENSFSISFAALNFVSPENNKYAYKLDNFDTEWLNSGAENRTAKYTNLPAGSYTLKVKASNADGYWNNDARTIKIVISPPAWNTYWARAIYMGLLVLGLWFFRKYTIITNTRKNQLLIEHFQKEKIEELSQLKLRFFTNVSHEFRTPLTLILGLIDRLKNSKDELQVHERITYYDKIYRNSQVLLNLINQLLDFRKVEQGKMIVRVAQGNIGEYIKLLAENFNELAKRKDIEYTYICENPITGYYDKDVLERMVFNLLSNAFKFSEREDEITVSLEVTDEHMLKLDVEDTGAGMSKEVQEHVFERFSSSQAKTESGSGIGLSYTKALVELYHGTIAFTSKENVGTKFTLLLPYTKDAFKEDTILENNEELTELHKDVNWLIDTGEPASQNGDTDRLKRENSILLVEDNEDILFYLKDHFKNSYVVHTAHDGQEALDICLKEHIDLVVSDVMMPGMDGLEFCEKLKDDDRINHIPVILLTAKKSTDNKVKGYEKGADAYIGKPFEMHELETRMEALISSRKKLLSKIRKNIDLEPSEIEITSLDERFLRRVMAYIEENIGMTEFTVDMLARECGMSQLHLNKKLKVLVGQTANAFVRTIRLKRAAQLLAKDRYSVNEVMYEVGFIDAKYFRSCFKKEFGITPSDYQKQHSTVE